MRRTQKSASLYFAGITVAATAAVFVASLASPDSLAIWLLYLVPIGTSYWLPNRRAAIWVAVICAILTLASQPLQRRSEIPLRIVLTNRAIEAVVFIVAGFTLAAYRRLSDDLQTQRDHLAQAQAVAQIGSWETELATGHVTWSLETHRIFGTDPRSFAPTHSAFMDMVHPDDRDRVGEAFARSLDRSEECRVEHRVTTTQGEAKVVEERWQMVLAGEGKPVRAVGTVQDLTSRVAAETQRELLAASLLAARETTSDAFIAVDRDVNVTYVNAQAEKLLNLSREQLLGRSMWNFFDPVHFPRLREAMVLAFSGRPSEYDNYTETFGRWVHVRVFPARDGVHVFFRDTTEERNAQAALARQARLIDEARDAIMLRDLDDRVVFWSRGCERIFGWSAAEAVGRSVHDLVAVDRQAYDAARQAVMAAGDWRGLLEVRDRAGVARVLDCRWQVTNDDPDRPTGILAIDSDISAQRDLEQRLRGTERRHLSILESANDAIVVFTPDSIITHWNAAATELFGYTAEEMIGRSALILVPPDERAGAVARKERALRDGTGVRDVETVRLRKDGTRIPVAITLSVLRDDAGHPSGISLITRDLTERNRATEQLRALSRRIETLQEQERSAIAREVHDELGQSLTVLRMDAARLAGMVRGNDEAAQLVAEVSDQIDATMQQARSIARALHPTALEDLGLAAALEMQAHHVARRAGLELHLDLGDVEPLDHPRAAAVYRIFQESLTNVVRHANARTLRIALSRSSGHLTLEVIDDGTGIQERPSDPFSSLGLLGMRERAAAFGGSVSIGPTEPRGTRVSLHLPLPEARKL